MTQVACGGESEGQWGTQKTRFFLARCSQTLTGQCLGFQKAETLKPLPSALAGANSVGSCPSHTFGKGAIVYAFVPD